ncbi:MAG TPA: hypothetical protein VNN23_10670 [Ornithinibacter sp.]|nr:hypothetical protein [Ornithinibacter sp.]
MRTMLDAEGLADDETEGASDPEEYVLLDGDVLMSKVTIATSTVLGDAWITYGVQTRVMQGESEEHAFTRLASITTNRAIDEARAVEAAVAEESAMRAEELRQHRISTSRNG